MKRSALRFTRFAIAQYYVSHALALAFAEKARLDGNL
jgi:hypothetical protein